MPTGIYKRSKEHRKKISKWTSKKRGHQNVGFKIDDNGCYIWQNCTDGRYGQIVHNGIKLKAHRYYFENKYGKIPIGFELDHLCNNTKCVNPEHLRICTHKENMQRFHRERQRALYK
jgi:hypothetical protein